MDEQQKKISILNQNEQANEGEEEKKITQKHN